MSIIVGCLTTLLLILITAWLHKRYYGIYWWNDEYAAPAFGMMVLPLMFAAGLFVTMAIEGMI